MCMCNGKHSTFYIFRNEFVLTLSRLGDEDRIITLITYFKKRFTLLTIRINYSAEPFTVN